jgi:hypothetical protein
MLAATQLQLPGHRFAMDGEVSSHHNVVHWGWQLLTPEGEVMLSGLDVAHVVDGKIALLTGFFNS